MELLSAEWLLWPQTQALVKAFGDKPLRFVGGAVRDALLKIPVQDVDVATTLLPQEVISLLETNHIKAIPTGIDHGTITALVEGKHFEITTLRRDVTTDGRRATVAYTQEWEEDAARRDFTINALYCDSNGKVTDFFDGVADARAGRVRFIGNANERIKEDALRILRFFRFFAHYGRDPINQEGLEACARAVRNIDTLSGERICREMLKLLVAERAYEVISIMQHYEIWPHVVGHVVTTEALATLPAILRKANQPPDAFLALACVLRTIQKPARLTVIESIITRWKLSKAQNKHLRTLCTNVPCPQEDLEIKKSVRALGKTVFIEQSLLRMAEGAEEAQELAAIELARSWEVPIFPVTGKDLSDRGIKPGKDMGNLLKTLEAQWEESGYILDKSGLFNFLK